MSSNPTTFPLAIISPAAQVFSGQAALVEVPGAEGDFGVLPGHSAFMSMVRTGVITVTADIGEKKFFVGSGYADVSPEGVTILSEQAVDLEDVDRAALETDLAQAKARLDVATTETEKAKAEQELATLLALQSTLT
jgi:F-type H+-transporting ATPase subunit epsilon